MKAKEIRGLDGAALKGKLADLRKELVKLNAQIALGASIKNPGQVKQVKKTIAKLLTVETERVKGINKKTPAESSSKKAEKKITKTEVKQKA